MIKPADLVTFTKEILNSLSANPTKWSNTLKQFVGKSRRIVLSVFDHFVGLALSGLMKNFIFVPCILFDFKFQYIFIQSILFKSVTYIFNGWQL